MKQIGKVKIICTLLVWLSLQACSGKQENTAVSHQKLESNNPAELTTDAKPTVPEVKASQLINPGKSIGLTKLQEKAEQVGARLGKPDVSDAAMGKALATWFSKPAANAPDTTRHQTTIYFTTNMGAPDEASRVNQIRVTSPYFRTADSVQVGSNWAFIQQKYPEAIKAAAYKLPNKQSKITICDAIAAGIAFEIDEQGRCVAITIHQPQHDIRDSYLPLFPDMEKYE
ncbi:hypothetical protein AHMF7605_13330 [Adhaeribacter arboris]|uniref:Uncharacterized protein n=1 Tax=Adhaeribacter arboris TaxID=2072846 RepID=A0A2T2YG03_9BACT|nr:hypothetical protein [Adhaeribacter arboris]PSR54422.1 hypothetical protein AHMF7605_13330 [Adhaeribacter arboris]